MIDVMIPVAGIALIVMVYIEGTFQVLHYFFANVYENEGDDGSIPEAIAKLVSCVRTNTRL